MNELGEDDESLLDEATLEDFLDPDKSKAQKDVNKKGLFGGKRFMKLLDGF